MVALAASAMVTLAASSSAATVIHFQSEGLSSLEGQLHKHEVHALTFHPTPTPGHVHVSMDDGRHYTVVYAATSDQERLIALAHTDGIPVTVATAKTKSTTTHHKLRYIAAGILIVVILIVAAVLLIDRRRKLREEAGDAAGDPAT